MARCGFPHLLLVATTLAVIWLHLPPTANGHALIIKPISRNYWGYIDQSQAPGARFYQAHEMTGGGVGQTSQNGALKWPNHVYARCGEAANKPNKRFEEMSPSFKPATYQPGDEVEFHILISTPHYGGNQFRVCPPSFKAGEEEKVCILMERSDGKGDWWYFPPPGYSDNSYSTYTYTPVPGTYDFGNNLVYTTKFKLPKSLPWTGPSIIQWYWVTGNRCTAPPCKPEDRSCSTLAQLPVCGTAMAGFPEEYWNCMDIVIAGGSSGGGYKPTPAPAPKPAPVPQQPAPQPAPAPQQPAPKPAPMYTPKPAPAPKPSYQKPAPRKRGNRSGGLSPRARAQLVKAVNYCKKVKSKAKRYGLAA